MMIPANRKPHPINMARPPPGGRNCACLPECAWRSPDVDPPSHSIVPQVCHRAVSGGTAAPSGPSFSQGVARVAPALEQEQQAVIERVLGAIFCTNLGEWPAFEKLRSR